MTSPGRSCPVSYRYRPEELAGPACASVATLFVVGGLYGNTSALQAILDRVDSEAEPAAIIFNGDFHYLDRSRESFELISKTVDRHYATLGNIEAELVSDASEAGCGCGYPEYVADEVVARSNEIMAALRQTASRIPASVTSLSRLPHHRTFDIDGVRVGVIHGDPTNLAGWALAVEALEPGDEEVRRRVGWTGVSTSERDVADWFERMNVRVLASTHTGLPYAQDYDVGDERCLVFNNGAAGLPALREGPYGTITRISSHPETPSDSLYGAWNGLRCDALPVVYDIDQWLARFEESWSEGSAAYESYYRQFCEGADFSISQAARGTIKVNGDG
jgi:predicted phosphodiesterase